MLDVGYPALVVRSPRAGRPRSARARRGTSGSTATASAPVRRESLRAPPRRGEAPLQEDACQARWPTRWRGGTCARDAPSSRWSRRCAAAAPREPPSFPAQCLSLRIPDVGRGGGAVTPAEVGWPRLQAPVPVRAGLRLRVPLRGRRAGDSAGRCCCAEAPALRLLGDSSPPSPFDPAVQSLAPVGEAPSGDEPFARFDGNIIFDV